MIVTASDGDTGTTATLTVTVTGVNDAPVAVADVGRTVKDTRLNVANDAAGATITVSDGSTATGNADLLLNDSDIDDDDDSLTISAVNGDTASVGKAIDVADGGKFTINADGSWDFDPDGDFDDLKDDATRTTSVTYTVSDGNGGTSEPATLTVTVTGANAAPTPLADAGTAEENKVRTVADGDTGTVMTNADSSTMTINADLLLNDTDPDGDTILTITAVKGYTRVEVDDAPDTYTARAEQAVVAGTPTSTLGDKGGTFTIAANGSWSFDPGEDFDNLAEGAVRTTSVQYTASDVNGATSALTTLTVTVTGANDPLTAKDDTGAATEGTVLTVPNDRPANIIVPDPDGDPGDTISVTTDGADLLLNDEDKDIGDSRTITAIKGYTNADPDDDTRQDVAPGAVTHGSSGGTFTINANGSWTFNPGSDFENLAKGETRTTEVAYTASDGEFPSTAKVTVTVTGINDDPMAIADTGRTSEHGTLTVAADTTGTSNAGLLLNDVDIDGDTLSITLVGRTEDSQQETNVGKAIDGSNGGTFTIADDGSWTFDPDGNKNKNFDDLKAGATRTTSVAYIVSDGNGGTDTAKLTVTVTGEDDDPVAVDDAGTTDEDTKLMVANDATGTTITVTVPDPDGDPGDTMSVTMTGNAGLLVNDEDVDIGDILTITKVGSDESDQSQQETNVGSAIDGSNGGSFTIEANGAWTFDPGTAFDDLADDETRTTSVAYTMSDGEGETDTATLTVTVTGANDAPVAVNDDGTTTENKMLTVANDAVGTIVTNDDGTTMTVNRDLLFGDDNDSDAEGDDLTITLVGTTEDNQQAANIGKAVNGSNGGTFTIRADGSWSFDPGEDFDDLHKTSKEYDTARTTSVTYTVFDGTDTNTATLTVTVTGQDDVPGLSKGTGTVTEDVVAPDADGKLMASGTLTVKGGDAGEDEFKVETFSDPDTYYGSLEIKANGAWTWTADNNNSKIQAIGAGDSPTDTFTVTNADGVTTTSVTITINGANDKLTANHDTGATTEETTRTVAADATGTTNAGLLINDKDIDGDTLTITGVNGDTDNVGKAVDGSKGGRFTIDSKGGWTFDPDGDFNGLAAGTIRTTQVTYTASDPHGETGTATLTVTVTVAGMTPTITGDTAGMVTEDKAVVSGNLEATGKLTATGGDDGENEFKPETILDTDEDPHYGSLTITAAGAWTYKIANASVQGLEAGETLTDTFTVTSADGITDETVTITIHGADDTPVAVDDTGETTENKILTVADDATGTTSGTTIINADLLRNDEDMDGDTLTITEVDGDTGSVGKATDGSDGGSFTIRANGSWEFNPGTDFDDLKAGVTRTTSVEYTASDGSLTDTATLTVTVTGTNDGLTANDDAGTTTENTDLTVADGATGTTSGTTTTNADLLLNDVDIDGDDLTITEVDGDTGSVGKATDGSDGGSFTIDSKGGWTFDPDGDFDDLAAGVTRTTSVVYTASDGTLTDTATVTVTVTGANDAPTANDDTGATTENAVLTVADGARVGGGAQRGADLLLNDTDVDRYPDLDPDRDTLTITLVGTTEDNQQAANIGKAVNGSNGGTFTIRADGSWTFDPDGNKDNNFNDLADGKTRTTSVAYTTSDGSLTDTATLTVTVTGTNDGLTANDDAGTTTENKMLTVADGATGTTSGTTTGPGGGAQRVNADLLLNDVDIDGDDLTITEVDGDTGSVGKATDGSDGGSFTIDSKGGWTFDPNSDFDDLAAGVTRTTSVVYTASDGTLTDTATLTVTVTGTNDGLTANDDVGTTTENKMLTVADGATGTTSGTTTTNADLLLNDVDIDGDDLTITEVDGDTGSVGKATDGSDGGSFTIDSKGGWTFDPNSDFDDLAAGVTRTTSVVYTASDGTLTDTATLTVTVTGTNDGFDGERRCRHHPRKNKMLTVADGATGTTSGTTTGPGGGAQRVNADLLLNDVDIDGDDLTITEVDGDTGSVGKATDGSDGGSFTIDSKGGWTFDPNSDFDDLAAAGVTRTTSVVYTASDGTLTDTATLTVTVTGTNDGLTANDDAGTTTENKMLTVADGATGTTSGTTTTNADLLLNDVDIDGDDLTITEVDGDTGSVGKATDGSDGGSFTIDSKGGWTFDPNKRL